MLPLCTFTEESKSTTVISYVIVATGAAFLVTITRSGLDAKVTSTR